MKITKTQLKQIIKEELGRVLNEAVDPTEAFLMVMHEMGAKSEERSAPLTAIFKQMTRDKGVDERAADDFLRNQLNLRRDGVTRVGPYKVISVGWDPANTDTSDATMKTEIYYTK